LFTDRGKINIKNLKHQTDASPIMEGCTCYTCQNFSRAYLRHLYIAKELLSARLNTLHNLHYYCDLMQRARNALEEGRWSSFRDDFLSTYRHST